MIEESKHKKKYKRTLEKPIFPGFEPEDLAGEYFHLPSVWMSIFSAIDNLAELKIVLYIMRHTWGFREYETYKRISTDEFAHGRKQKGRVRMDNGTGLSKQAIIDGIAKAIEHGFVECETDDSDRARIEKSYRIKIKPNIETNLDMTETQEEKPKLKQTKKTAIPRLQALRSMPYSEYLQTPEWQEKRKKALRFAGFRCQLCNSADRLNVHHRTYERLGQELMGDMITLCNDCHVTFHQNRNLAE